MKKSELREKALNGLFYSLAFDDMGIYPKKMNGVERTEWQDGWNEYGCSLIKTVTKIQKWLNKEVPKKYRKKIENLLLAGSLHAGIYEDKVYMSVNCNDLWYWACSDAEDVELEDIDDLLQAYKDSPTCGDILWACRKRKMRPQKPYYKYLAKEEHKFFNAVGPKRKD